MTITTKAPTEANLEARVDATLQRVFAGVPDLKHQLRFKIRLGRNEFDIGSDDYVDGRADIIVFQGNAPLAVIELKREGLALTCDDEQQGRSYAIWSPSMNKVRLWILDQERYTLLSNCESCAMRFPSTKGKIAENFAQMLEWNY